MKTPKTKPKKRAVSYDGLLDYIADLLGTAPHSAIELAKLTGYGELTCRHRLGELEALGRAHRQRVGLVGAGWTYVWHAGPADPSEVISMITHPRQSTVRTYPPVNRRDPLVAALFGQVEARP
jgi:hypothetical protein